MMEKTLQGFEIFVLLLLLPVSGFSFNSSLVQSQSDRMIIGTRVVPPFVIEEDGEYSGLTVTLWDHIASEMEINYRFEETTIQGMMDSVASGNYYASASALTITSERETIVDFTHPYYVTGMGIAVSYQPAGLWQSLLAIFSPDFLWVVFLLIILLLFWGFLIWFLSAMKTRKSLVETELRGLETDFGGLP